MPPKVQKTYTNCVPIFNFVCLTLRQLFKNGLFCSSHHDCGNPCCFLYQNRVHSTVPYATFPVPKTYILPYFCFNTVRKGFGSNMREKEWGLVIKNHMFIKEVQVMASYDDFALFFLLILHSDYNQTPFKAL